MSVPRPDCSVSRLARAYIRCRYMTIQSVPHDKIDTLNMHFRPLRAERNRRNRRMVEKINALLPDVRLDFDRGRGR